MAGQDARALFESLKQHGHGEARGKRIADCRLEMQENIDWNTAYRSSFFVHKDLKLIVFFARMIQRLSFTFSGFATYPLFFGKILNNRQLVV